MKRFLTTGFLGAFLGIVIGSAPADASLISRGFLDEVLTSYATNTALDLKANQTDLTALSNKIGTLPEGTIDIGGIGLSEMFGKEKSFPVTIPSDYTLSDAFQNLFYSEGVFPSFVDIAEYTMYGGTLSSYWESIYGIKTYKGLLELTKDIGTLPSGEIVSYGPPLIEMLQDYSYQYPKDLAGIYDVLFGTGENMGVLERFATSTLFGVPNSFSGLLSIGTVPDGKNLAGMISETDAKIGTLPSGVFPVFPGNMFLSVLNQPYTYPTSLAELITAIYGNAETGVHGLLEGIFIGFPYYDTDGDGQKEPGVGLMPNFNLAKNANNLATTANTTATAAKTAADANTAKIGTLPTEYATVGAALTAIKSDIDAKSLPSTSADGQYVLTAKKVGETISYTWVKMDLTNEEQSQ